jgi:preprotein translocase subunit YajC
VQRFVKDYAGLLWIVLILVVFYLLFFRPQRRRQQEMTATQSALEIGTEVMLSSGIFGRVTAVDEETLRLEVAPGTTVKVARQAVVRVVQEDAEAGPPADGSTGPDGSVEQQD